MSQNLPSSFGVTKSTAKDTINAEYNDIKSVNKIVKKFKNKIAAIIIEPIAGNMGLVRANKDFLMEIRKICDTNKILLIFDEVMSGFRVSRGGAQEIYNVKPDIICCGKGISSSLPLAAVLGRADVMDLPEIGSMSSTHSANPLSCAAGLANLEEIERLGLVEKSMKKGAILHKRLSDMQKRFKAF